MPSDKAPESPSEEYLCDYLYLDTQRLAHYYSQLSEHGLVTQSKHMSKSGGKEDSKLRAGPRFFGGEINQGKSAEESLELQVDPAFRRPQETLDALYDAGLIHKGLGGIGQLCLFDGLLNVVDIRMMKELWPLMGGMFAEQEASGISNQKEKQKKIAEVKKVYGGMADLLKHMPHSLQGSIASDEGDAWYTLDPKYMLVNPEDIIFKHGCDIVGVWHMLCIVDAYPDVIYKADHSEFFNGVMETAMRQLVDGLRTAFGRPAGRYGITPIMIFRTIKKPVAEVVEASAEIDVTPEN